MSERVAPHVASYVRERGSWLVQFRDPDIATFGRTLAAAKRHARSALAVHLEVSDLAAAGIEVVDDVELPPEVSDEIARLSSDRANAERLRTEVARSTRRAAADLRRRGFSTRDVGELLGISASRVAQMDRERPDR